MAFFKFKHFVTTVELPQKIVPYVMFEWMYEKYIVFKLFTDKFGFKVISI
jgi:hypothetical protein